MLMFEPKHHMEWKRKGKGRIMNMACVCQTCSWLPMPGAPVALGPPSRASLRFGRHSGTHGQPLGFAHPRPFNREPLPVGYLSSMRPRTFPSDGPIKSGHVCRSRTRFLQGDDEESRSSAAR